MPIKMTTYEITFVSKLAINREVGMPKKPLSAKERGCTEIRVKISHSLTKNNLLHYQKPYYARQLLFY
jgi:hypothetical protein